MPAPSTEANDRLSPRLEGPPRFDGTVGGEGRKGVIGEEGKRPAALIGDGRPGAREDVGELCAGLDGKEGPPPEVRGECCRREGEGE